MRRMKKKEIIFLQPGYAHYRDKLFYIISDIHDVLFLFEKSKNTYPGNDRPKKIQHIFLDEEYKFTWLGLIQILIKNKPDIVITSVSRSMRTVISFLYSIIYNKKHILWILEWRHLEYPKNNIINVLKKVKCFICVKIIKYTDALVVGGTAAYNYVLSLGADTKKIFIALQCAEDLLTSGTGIKNKMENDKKTFLYLGRIISLKGLDILIRAFAELEKDEEVHLIVAGDGPYKKYCEDLSKSLDVHNISFIGEILPKETAMVYRRADVFILPSRYEGNYYESWGLVINEAMCMGLPVITTWAVGASYDLMYEGENGFIVKEDSVQDLYFAMKKMLKVNLNEFGAKSRKIIDEKVNYNKMANGFLSAITFVSNR